VEPDMNAVKTFFKSQTWENIVFEASALGVGLGAAALGLVAFELVFRGLWHLVNP
jgi:hypothetical protein